MWTPALGRKPLHHLPKMEGDTTIEWFLKNSQLGGNMKIYKLNLDVDNYQGCFINETNLTKRDFKEINRGRKLTFKEGCITFNYANDEGLKIGDVILRFTEELKCLN